MGRRTIYNRVCNNKTRCFHWELFNSQVCGDWNRHFKPKHDVFQTLTERLWCLNSPNERKVKLINAFSERTLITIIEGCIKNNGLMICELNQNCIHSAWWHMNAVLMQHIIWNEKIPLSQADLFYKSTVWLNIENRKWAPLCLLLPFFTGNIV